MMTVTQQQPSGASGKRAKCASKVNKESGVGVFYCREIGIQNERVFYTMEEKISITVNFVQAELEYPSTNLNEIISLNIARDVT